MYDACKALKPWRSQVKRCAVDALGISLIKGPVVVCVTFLFARPPSQWNRSGALKASSPDQHVYKPDTDKLVRAVLDSLTEIAYRDDSQVVRVEASKAWCGAFEEPGAWIVVGPGAA